MVLVVRVAGISLSEYARRKGVSRQYVSRLAKEGRLPLDGEGRVDSVAADAALAAVSDPTRPRRSVGVVAVESEPSGAVVDGPRGLTLTEARTRRESIRARSDELSLQERLGELLPRREVEDALFSAGRVARENLLGLPSRLAAELAAESDPRRVEERLTVELRRVIVEMVDALKRFGGSG